MPSFLILPCTFDIDPQLRVSQTALGIFSVALLTAGFSLTGLLCFACRNWFFQADSVFTPALVSCTLGLFTVFFSFAFSRKYVWNVVALLVTVGSSISIVVYATLLIWTFRRIAAVRKNAPEATSMSLLGQPQNPLTQGLSTSYHDPSYFDNHLANMYPAARPTQTQESRSPPDEITEEDHLRQQMLMLLTTRPEPPSGGSSGANTFNRIEFSPLDEPEPPRHRASSTLQSPGPPAYHGYHGYYAPSASRQSSQQSWQGTPAMPPWDGIWRGGGDVIDLATREERRRQIEQGR